MQLERLHCSTIKVHKGQTRQTYRLFAKPLRKPIDNAMREKLLYYWMYCDYCMTK